MHVEVEHDDELDPIALGGVARARIDDPLTMDIATEAVARER